LSGSFILAGSVVRGEHTESSDLDIIIFDKGVYRSYRESLIVFDWPLEIFVHNLSSYKDFFRMDSERARPSLPRMVSEGIVLKDIGINDSIKKEANEILIMVQSYGP
jgi:predicted nucleotidyltransferase